MTADHGRGREDMTLDGLLRQRRRAAGLTQSELAQRAGVGVRTVRDLERGRSTRPQRTTIELIATALGLTGAERMGFLAAARTAAVDQAAQGGGPATAQAAGPTPAPAGEQTAGPVTLTAPSLSLPPPPPLIGRTQDVAELSAMLIGPEGSAPPVVTLVGLAGVGKTGLALAVADRVAHRHSGGVAGVRATEGPVDKDILATVAAVFGVARPQDLPARLVGAPTLLLIDAIERDPDAVAELVHWLARRAPNVRVLATGRHPIGLLGERVWPVTPLEVPPAEVPVDLAAIASYPAAELFLARLSQVRREPPDPAELPALVKLVRRLGGLPLALELAAARGRVLDLTELLHRYGDRVLDLSGPPTRRQAVAGTLRDAVAASYRLLEPYERAALRRLAVFRNRWSVELAEAMFEPGATTGGAGAARRGAVLADSDGGVAQVDGGSGSGTGAEADDATALAELAADPVPLLDRLLGLGLLSTLGTGPFRFRLLDVVRDFAVEQSAADGELTTIRRQYATVLARMATRISADLTGANQSRAVGLLDSVSGDLWAALAYAATDDPHTALQLAVQLPRWWRFRGRDVAGRQWLRRLLDDPRTNDANPVLRAWAQVGIAQLAQEHGEGPTELTTVQQALWQFQQAGDVAGELAARNVLCGLYTAVGGHDEARRHGEAALALAGRAGRIRDMVVAQNNLTWHDIRVGELAAARRRLAAVDRLAAQCGEERLRVLARANLAEVARLDGRYADAVRQGRRVVGALAELGDPGHRWRVLGTVGLALAQGGHLAEAESLLTEMWTAVPAAVPDSVPAVGTRAAGGPQEGILSLLEGHLALRRGDRERAAEWFAAAERSCVAGRDVRDVVESLVGLVASLDDPVARKEARRRLDEVSRDGGITLLPGELALIDESGRAGPDRHDGVAGR
ncbi:ATP-binding protein [Plantactinospora sp. GCM10030261]|uniref:ATP-binding protein n=1 Tax=Plantactinospora sp. GCM10030261 TaxID=3273420 RepID=UPI00360FEDD2